MFKLRHLVITVLAGLFSLSLLFSTGCSRHPNPEQISMMEEARSACLAAEQKLNEKIKEREGLEEQLASKQDELDGLKKEVGMIKQRLSNWKAE